MAILPNELIAYLFTCLPTSELKAFRLTCRSYADIGQTVLFKDLEFKLWPDYHRIYHLEQLAAHPVIASKLKCISFESGVLHENTEFKNWQTEVYHEISSKRAQGLAARGEVDDTYEAFHSALQGRFTPDLPHKYSLYRLHIDQQADFLAGSNTTDTLLRVFNLLYEHIKHVRFKVVMKEPRITLIDLEAFDADQYSYQYQLPEQLNPRRCVLARRRTCLRHFYNFLLSATQSKFAVTDFVGIDLPKELLGMDAGSIDSPLRKSFKQMRDATINIGGLPYSDWLSRDVSQDVYRGGRYDASRRLRELLDMSTNLESLRLAFPRDKQAEFSFDLFDRTNIDRFPRSSWMPHLRLLSLSQFRCTWADLQALLREGKSLETLCLADCTLETGSMIDVLQFFPQLCLSSISVAGSWHCHEDIGIWHSHSPDDFNSCPAATSYEGPYVHNGMRKQLEDFMLHGGVCPLPRCSQDGRELDIWELKGDTSWHFLPLRVA